MSNSTALTSAAPPGACNVAVAASLLALLDSWCGPRARRCGDTACGRRRPTRCTSTPVECGVAVCCLRVWVPCERSSRLEALHCCRRAILSMRTAKAEPPTVHSPPVRCCKTKCASRRARSPRSDGWGLWLARLAAQQARRERHQLSRTIVPHCHFFYLAFTDHPAVMASLTLSQVRVRLPLSGRWSRALQPCHHSQCGPPCLQAIRAPAAFSSQQQRPRSGRRLQRCYAADDKKLDFTSNKRSVSSCRGLKNGLVNCRAASADRAAQGSWHSWPPAGVVRQRRACWQPHAPPKLS